SLVQIDSVIERLAVSQRDRGRRPCEEPNRRRPELLEAAREQRLVERHIVSATRWRTDEESERGHAPAPDACASSLRADGQRRFGCRAASVWSRRRTGVVTGASRINSGAVSASRAIWIIASQNWSRVSLDSVSVGSIMSASSTISGK